MKKLFSLCLLVLLLNGCSYSHEKWARRNMGFISYYNFVYPTKPVNHPVELYYRDNKPTADYMILGKIDAFIDSSTQINPLLEAKIRQSGGDGAINIKAELMRMEEDSYVSTSVGYGNTHRGHYGYHGSVAPNKVINYKDVYKVSAEVIRFNIEKAIIVD